MLEGVEELEDVSLLRHCTPGTVAWLPRHCRADLLRGRIAVAIHMRLRAAQHKQKVGARSSRGPAAVLSERLEQEM